MTDYRTRQITEIYPHTAQTRNRMRRSPREHGGSIANDAAGQNAAPAPEPALHNPMDDPRPDGQGRQFAEGIRALLQQQHESRERERQFEAFNRGVCNLKDDTPIRSWVEQVKRLRPDGIHGEELWTVMCKKVPAEQHDITMSYYEQAEGHGEAKLRAAFKTFARAHGDESTEDGTWKNLMSFKQKEYESPAKAILRFNSMYQAYATVCTEEAKEPRTKESESIKTAFLAGLGLLTYVSDFSKSFADIETQARQVIKNLATARLTSDLNEASSHTVRRSRQEVLASEQMSMTESLKKTFRELRNELSRSMQDELQGSIPKIVASITEKTRIDESKRRPPEDTSGAKRPKTRARSPEPQTGPPCPNFRKGKCEGGRSCYYSHNDDRRRNDDHHRRNHPRKQRGACSWWKSGRCRFGSRCEHRHSE